MANCSTENFSEASLLFYSMFIFICRQVDFSSCNSVIYMLGEPQYLMNINFGLSWKFGLSGSLYAYAYIWDFSDQE